MAVRGGGQVELVTGWGLFRFVITIGHQWFVLAVCDQHLSLYAIAIVSAVLVSFI